MGHKLNLTQHRFGKLVALEPIGKDKHNRILWRCKCDCGNEKIVAASALRSGNTASCGCLHDELFMQNRIRHDKHGERNTRLYRIWSGMKQRCYNPGHHKYHRYGGRGIEVCEEWRDSFETFRDWALANGYRDDLTIDREDNDGSYSPENCRWATTKEQANNVSYNLVFNHKGEEKTLKEWAREYGINYHTVYSRIFRQGWDFERAITTKGDARRNEK